MAPELFYKELGRLLYAIAAADGKVSAKEVAQLKEVVSKQLVPFESSEDAFGTDQAYITEFEFDVLAERGETADDTFESFITYIGQHRNELTDGLIAMIERCADAVANSFHGVNVKELGLLIELRKHLHKAGV